MNIIAQIKLLYKCSSSTMGIKYTKQFKVSLQEILTPKYYRTYIKI